MRSLEIVRDALEGTLGDCFSDMVQLLEPFSPRSIEEHFTRPSWSETSTEASDVWRGGERTDHADGPGAPSTMQEDEQGTCASSTPDRLYYEQEAKEDGVCETQADCNTRPQWLEEARATIDDCLSDIRDALGKIGDIPALDPSIDDLHAIFGSEWENAVGPCPSDTLDLDSRLNEVFSSLKSVWANRISSFDEWMTQLDACGDLANCAIGCSASSGSLCIAQSQFVTSFPCAATEI